MISLTNCTFGYANKHLFEIDALNLLPGSLIGLIGANGCGKSTFLKALSLAEINQGIGVLNGVESKLFTNELRAKTLAFVTNEFKGFDHLTTLEYLELGRFPYTGFMGRLSALDHSIVRDFCTELKLTDLLTLPTSLLSDGERQRVNIARALIQQTPIVLLDEPTSFLDYPSKRMVMELLLDCAKKHKKLIVFSTHDIELAKQYTVGILVVQHDSKKMVLLPSETPLEKFVQTAYAMP